MLRCRLLMHVEALIYFWQVCVTSLAKRYFVCAPCLRSLPALFGQPSAFECRQRSSFGPRFGAKSRVVWSMLTNEQLTSIAQVHSSQVQSPLTLVDGGKTSRFSMIMIHAGCTGVGDCYPRSPYLSALEMRSICRLYCAQRTGMHMK
jgi:hypothetical protein